MKRTIRVFSLLLAAVMLLSAQALATEPAQAVTDVEHSGQYLCGLPRVEPAQAFTDVTKQDYFYDAVNWTVEKEITSGVSKDAFAPERDCTRADFVTFLWRAAGSPEPASTEPAYTDVTDTSLYFFKAVQWASEQGLVEGETFDPYAGCTRAMAVYFMWVAADSPEAAAASFTDVAADADYAAAVNWAVAQGVTLGTGDGSTFSPDTVCQRGQIVTFLYRAANAAA